MGGTTTSSTSSAPTGVSDSKIILYDSSLQQQYQQEKDSVNLTNLQDSINNAKEPLYESWFADYSPTSCNDFKVLTCPELKDEYKQNYSVISNGHDYERGMVSCSIYPKIDFSNLGSFGLHFDSPLYSKTFFIPVCKNKFDFNHEDNYDNTVAGEQIRQKLNDRLNDIKAIVSTAKQENTGFDKAQLDLADIVDATLTLDSDIIDLETTLISGEFEKQSNYELRATDANIIDEVRISVENIIKFYNGDSTLTSSQRENLKDAILSERDKNFEGLFKSFGIYLEYMILSSSLINSFASFIVLFFLMRNIIISYAGKKLSTKITNTQTRDDWASTAVVGTTMVILFFAAHTQTFHLQNTSNDLATSSQTITIEHKSLRAQTIFSWFNSKINSYTDDMTGATMTMALNKVAADSNIITTRKYDLLSSKKIVLENENNYLKDFDKECQNIYDIAELQRRLNNFKIDQKENVTTANTKTTIFKYDSTFTNFLNERLNDIGILGKSEKFSLRAAENPFPVSEREVFILYSQNFNEVGFSSKLKGLSPYIQATKIPLTSQNFKTFSSCSYNRQKLVDNIKEIERLDLEISNISNDTNWQAKTEMFEQLTKNILTSHENLGYFALPLLWQQIEQAKKFGLNSDDLKDTDILDIARDNIVDSLFSLFLFDGIGYATTLHSLSNSFSIDKIFSTLKPKFLDKLTISEDDEVKGPGLIEYTIVSQSILKFLDMLASKVFFVVVIIVLISIMKEKIVLFISFFFHAKHAFKEGQAQHFDNVINRVAALGIKTAMLPVSIAILFFINAFLDDLVPYLNTLNSFQFDALSNNYDIYSDDNYFIKQYTMFTNQIEAFVSEQANRIIFIIIQLYMIVTIVMRFSEAILEAIDLQTSQAISNSSNTLVDNANTSKDLKAI
jgi:hypothetical protein